MGPSWLEVVPWKAWTEIKRLNFSVCPRTQAHDDIMSRVDDRRRQLEMRMQAASTSEQRRLLERALTELEEVRALVMLDPRDPAAGLPGGAMIVLKSGTMVADRYVIKERLGNGERGAVFRALDLTWGKDIALKVLLPEVLLVPGTMDRLAAMLHRILQASPIRVCATPTQAGARRRHNLYRQRTDRG